MTDILTRSFELRATNDEERIVEGILVPWGETYDARGAGFRERFERGAFPEGDGVGMPLYGEHGHLAARMPIGVIIDARDTDEGRHISARISRTPAGDEAYTLSKDGALRWSVGFENVEDRDEDGVTVRTKALTREASLTGIPAYKTAAVTGVRNRQETPDMPDTTITAADLTETRSAVEEQGRRLAVLEANGPAAPAGPPAIDGIRHLADFVKGLADGNTRQHAAMVAGWYEAAAENYRASETTATTGATVVPTWVDRDIKLVNRGRKLLNLFSKAPLPAEGTTINYPKFASATGDVAAQAAENAALEYLKLVITSASAAVTTYGGYTSMSRQTIERSSVAYLAKILDYMKISYGKVTNGAVRTALTGEAGAITGAPIFGSVTTAKAWVDAITDGVSQIDAQSLGLSGEFVVMGVHHFKALVGVVDTTGRPVFSHRGDGVNTIGSVNVPGLSANIEGVPVAVDPTIPATEDYAYLCSPDAITVMESGGAPFSLNDENITTLTKDFSLYGYMTLTVNDPKGIYKFAVTDTAA